MNKNSLPKSWQKYKFEDVLQYEQPTKYLVKSTKYSDEYTTPVLTAGKSFILGYTNETDGIFQDTPVIIFDDFTTATKFVNFKFKVKSSAMKILRPTQKADIKFLFYLMQIIQIRAETHKRYWISDYSKREIYLPSIAEQREIVSEIERRFEKLDKAIENFRQILKNLKLYRQSVLKFAFEGKFVSSINKDNNSNFIEYLKKEKEKLIKQSGIKISKKISKKDAVYPLFEIPKSWIWVNIHQICEVFGRIGFRGYTQKDIVDDKSKGAITLSPSNIINGKMNYNECRYVSWDKYNQSPEIKASIGDIMLVKTGSSYGKSAIINELPHKATINPQSVLIKFVTIETKFLLYYLQSFHALSQFELFVKGSAIPTFTQENLINMPIPIPPLSEQKQIVSEIEKRFAKADKIENLINKSIKNAEILKQSILKQAFSGNLKVKK